MSTDVALPRVRELKRNYKLLLAERRALSTLDLGIPLPLSTGDPVLDAALFEKIAATATMGEAEHLVRAWSLAAQSNEAQRTLLVRHARALLNDHKLLHALAAVARDDDATLDAMLAALPWAWRFGFPSAVIKPATMIFTGWRKRVPFRLVQPPPFERLRERFRATLARAPDAMLLKFRDAIKQSAALLKFRFEGERERAIHDLCFADGRAAASSGALPAVAAFVRARDALAQGGPTALVAALDEAPGRVPLTSLMGLLGQGRVHLPRGDHRSRGVLEPLRDHALASATGVEMLLKLHEWGSWLDERRCELIGKRVLEAVDRPGVNLPFFKVLKGFMAAPARVQKALARPMLLPLMQRFGAGLRALLPSAQSYTFVLPANMLRLTSLMLYAMVGNAGKARLLLLRSRGLAEPPLVELGDVVDHVAAGSAATQTWLKESLGAIALDTEYRYDVPALAAKLGALDPGQPLLLDVPFVEDARLVEALLPFELAVNLNPPLGAPGEVTVSYEFYAQSMYMTPRGGWITFLRDNDVAAGRFAEFVDRLQVMAAMAAEMGR
jgi:hypothetical protein